MNTDRPTHPPNTPPVTGWISLLKPVSCFTNLALNPKVNPWLRCFSSNYESHFQLCDRCDTHQPHSLSKAATIYLLGAAGKEMPPTPSSTFLKGSVSRLLQGLPLNNDTKIVCSSLSTCAKVVTPQLWEQRSYKMDMFDTKQETTGRGH